MQSCYWTKSIEIQEKIFKENKKNEFKIIKTHFRKLFTPSKFVALERNRKSPKKFSCGALTSIWTLASFVKTFFIDSADRIISADEINHYDLEKKTTVISRDFLPSKYPVEILLTSGASCPDAIVESVIRKIVSYYEGAKDFEVLVNCYQ